MVLSGGACVCGLVGGAHSQCVHMSSLWLRLERLSTPRETSCTAASSDGVKRRRRCSRLAVPWKICSCHSPPRKWDTLRTTCSSAGCLRGSTMKATLPLVNGKAGCSLKPRTVGSIFSIKSSKTAWLWRPAGGSHGGNGGGCFVMMRSADC